MVQLLYRFLMVSLQQWMGNGESSGVLAEIARSKKTKEGTRVGGILLYGYLQL